MTERISVDAATGGLKGVKLASFASIPPDALWALAEHFGTGNAKYPDPKPGLQNWQRGYAWTKSISAMLRHIFLFCMGQDYDVHTPTCEKACVEHTNSHHLIAAAWHCLVLFHWSKHGGGTDDRYFKHG